MPKANTFSGLAVNLRAMKLENTPEVRRVVADALVPLRDQVRANIHSITGKTSEATVIIEGRGNKDIATAYAKVDKAVAYVLSRGRRFFYPGAVEVGHRGKHAAPAHPFFKDAIAATRAVVSSRLERGLARLIAAKGNN